MSNNEKHIKKGWLSAQMKIFVDGDGCAVKSLIVEVASKHAVEVVVVISICHISTKDNYSKYIIVDNISQAVDMTIMNKAVKNDIVITDDYGLASVLLTKQVFCLSSRGYIYTPDNIDHLMFKRYMNEKIRRGGGKIKGPSKRNKIDDIGFINSLESIIKKCLYSSKS